MLNFKQEIELLSTFSFLARFLHDKGWAQATGGNISLRLPLHEFSPSNIKTKFPYKSTFSDNNPYTYLTDHVLILSASGSSMNEIASDPEQHVVICIFHHHNVELYAPLEHIKPTSEWKTHFAVHNMLSSNSKEDHILVHAHVPSLIAFSHIKFMLFRRERKINRLLFSLLPELIIKLPEGISILRFILPGSSKLAYCTSKAMLKTSVCLWQNHGIILRGKTLNDITSRLELLDHAVQIYTLINQMRIKPRILSRHTIRRLKKIFSSYPR